MAKKIYDEDIRLNLILNGQKLQEGSKLMVAELGKMEQGLLKLEQEAKAMARHINALTQANAKHTQAVAAEQVKYDDVTKAIAKKEATIARMKETQAGLTASIEKTNAGEQAHSAKLADTKLQIDKNIQAQERLKESIKGMQLSQGYDSVAMNKRKEQLDVIAEKQTKLKAVIDKYSQSLQSNTERMASQQRQMDMLTRSHTTLTARIDHLTAAEQTNSRELEIQRTQLSAYNHSISYLSASINNMSASERANTAVMAEKQSQLAMLTQKQRELVASIAELTVAEGVNSAKLADSKDQLEKNIRAQERLRVSMGGTGLAMKYDSMLLEEKKGKMDHLNQRYKTLTAQIDKYSESMRSNSARILEQQAELDKLTLKHKKLTEEISRLTNAGSTDTQKLRERKAQLDKVTLAIEQETAALNDQKTKQDQLKTSLDALKEEERENSAILKDEKAKYDALNTSIKAHATEIEKLRQRVGLAGMTVQQLRNYIKALQTELNNSPGQYGTAWFKNIQKEIREATIRVNMLTTGASRLSQAWERMAKAANRMGTIMGWFAVATFLVSRAISSVVHRMKELEDLIGTTRKNTGLLTEQVWEMKDAFDHWDTRTKSDDLLKLAIVAGKLGIQGKAEIMNFVDAANKIQIALGDDLNGSIEDTVTSVGKLMSAFRIWDKVNEETGKKFTIDEAMLRTGDVLNELAKSSAASAGTILEYMVRLSSVGELAGFTIDQIGALGSTLDALHVPSERGATAMQKIMLQLANPKKIANFAEAIQSLKETFQDTHPEVNLVNDQLGSMSEKYIKLLQNDPNFVLQTLLQKFVSTKEGLTDLVGGLRDFGVRGQYMTAVLGSLALNLDVYRQQLEIASKAWKDHTSVLNEYNIMNNNFTAEVEKQMKIIRAQGDYIKRQSEPAVLNMIKAWRWLVVAMRDTVDWINRHWMVLKVLTAAYITLKAPMIWHLNNMIITTAWHKIMATWEAVRIGYLKLSVLWTVKLTAEQTKLMRQSTLLRIAHIALTRGFGEAIAVMKRLGLGISAATVPMLATVATIAAVAGAIYWLVVRHKELTAQQKIQKELNEKNRNDIYEEKAKLEMLMLQLKDVNTTEEDRIKILQTLKNEYGEYLPLLQKEGVTAGEVAASYDELIKAMSRKMIFKNTVDAATQNSIQMQAAKDKLEELKKKEEAQQKVVDENNLITGKPDFNAIGKLMSIQSKRKNAEEDYKRFVDQDNKFKDTITKLTSGNQPIKRDEQEVKVDISNTKAEKGKLEYDISVEKKKLEEMKTAKVPDQVNIDSLQTKIDTMIVQRDAAVEKLKKLDEEMELIKPLTIEELEARIAANDAEKQKMIDSLPAGVYGKSPGKIGQEVKAYGEAVNKSFAESTTEFISKAEGTYDSINVNDGGAVSIGRMQWNADRAKQLLLDIRKADQDSFKTAAGEKFEVINALLEEQSWKNVTLTGANAVLKDSIKNVLATPAGKKVQDEEAAKNTAEALGRGKKMGVEDNSMLTYYADLENQYGIGGAAGMMRKYRRHAEKDNTADLNMDDIISFYTEGPGLYGDKVVNQRRLAQALKLKQNPAPVPINAPEKKPEEAKNLQAELDAQPAVIGKSPEKLKEEIIEYNGKIEKIKAKYKPGDTWSKEDLEEEKKLKTSRDQTQATLDKPANTDVEAKLNNIKELNQKDLDLRIKLNKAKMKLDLDQMNKEGKNFDQRQEDREIRQERELTDIEEKATNEFWTEEKESKAIREMKLRYLEEEIQDREKSGRVLDSDEKAYLKVLQERANLIQESYRGRKDTGMDEDAKNAIYQNDLKFAQKQKALADSFRNGEIEDLETFEALKSQIEQEKEEERLLIYQRFKIKKADLIEDMAETEVDVNNKTAKKLLADNDTKYANAKIELAKKYARGEIKGAENFKLQMLQIEKERLDAQLAILEKYNLNRANTIKKQTDNEIAIKDGQAKREKEIHEQIAKEGENFYKSEKQKIDQQYVEGQISKAGYDDAILKLEIQKYKMMQQLFEKFMKDPQNKAYMAAMLASWVELEQKLAELGVKLKEGEVKNAKDTTKDLNKEYGGRNKSVLVKVHELREEIKKSDADVTKSEEEKKAYREEQLAAIDALNEAEAYSFALSTANAVEGAKSYQEATVIVLNSIRSKIRAYMAEAVAAAVAKEIGTKGILGILTAGVVAGAVMVLFDSIIPKFEIDSSGGIGMSTLGSASQKAEGEYPILNLKEAGGIMNNTLGPKKRMNGRWAVDGKYPVIGADDGILYHAAMGGEPTTGMISHPTLLNLSGGPALVGEKGPEVIIDGNTVRRIQINAPELLRDIYAYAGKPVQSVTQKAKGSYPETAEGRRGETETVRTAETETQLLAALKKLNDHLDKGIKSKGVFNVWGTNGLSDTLDKMNRFKDKVGKNR